MQNVTESFLTANDTEKKYNCRITIGDVVLTNDDVININIIKAIEDGATLTFGNTIASTANVQFFIPSTSIDIDEKMKIEIGLKTGVNSTGIDVFEYVCLGHYNIANDGETDNVATYVAYDDMVKLDKEYIENVANPTLTTILQRISNICGITIAQRVYTKVASCNTTQIQIKGYTCREIISNIFSLMFRNAIINKSGELDFVYFSTTDTIAKQFDNTNYITLSKEKTNILIGDVEFNYADYTQKYTLWEDNRNARNMSISGGLINSRCYSNLDVTTWFEIYQDDILLFELRGYNMIVKDNLHLELGDYIGITPSNANAFSSFILNQSIIYDGTVTMTIGATGQSSIQNETTTKSDNENNTDRNTQDIGDIKDDLDNLSYDNLSGKPSINGIELSGNSTSADLGLADEDHNHDRPVSSHWFNGYANVGADGVMEVGKYIDFHATNTGMNDYDGRITLESQNVFSLNGATLKLGNLILDNDSWQDLTLAAGVSEYYSAYYKSRVRDKNGIIELQLGVKGPTTFPATIATLPVGYRPSRTLYFLGTYGESNPLVDKFKIGADGVITLTGSTSTSPSATVVHTLNCQFAKA